MAAGPDNDRSTYAQSVASVLSAVKGAALIYGALLAGVEEVLWDAVDDEPHELSTGIVTRDSLA